MSCHFKFSKYMWLILIVTIIMLVSGCEKKVTEITFRITWDEFSGRGDAIHKIVEVYNESQDRVHVTMISGNEDREEAMTLLDHGDVDVLVMPYRFIQDTSISDGLLMINEDFEEEMDKYYPSVINMAMKDEKLLGVPWIGHSMALVYNEDLVKAANIDIESWDSVDDLLEGCQQIEEKTEASGIGLVGAAHHDLSWMISQFVYSFDGTLVYLDEENNFIRTGIAEEEAKAGLSFYIDELGAYAQEGWEEDSGIEVLEHFKEGEVAFEIQGPWAISDIWKKGNPFKVNAISLGQLGISSEVGPMMLVVNANSEYPKEAMEFIKFMVEKDSLEMIMNGEYIPKYDAYYPFRVPIRKDMIDSAYFNKYSEFEPFIQGFEMPSISSPSPEWAMVQETVFIEELHKVILGNKTIDEAMRVVEEEIEQHINE